MTGLVSWTCVILYFGRIPEDGSPVSKHVGVDTLNYILRFVFYYILFSGEDSRGDHGLCRLVEFRFKGPPGTPPSYITTQIIGTT
jgi:hypothetical protein